MKNIYLIAIIIFLSFSCQETKNKSHLGYGKKVLKNISSIFFKIDSVSAYNYRFFDYGYVDSKESLIILNENNFSIDFYDLEKGVVFKRIDLPKEGPYQLDRMQGLTFHNQDSVFLFSYMMLKNNAILSFDSGVYHVFRPKLKQETVFDQILNHSSTNSMRTLVVDNELVFNHLSLRSPRSPSSFFEEVPSSFFLDLETDSMSYSSTFDYPFSYLQKTWPESFIFHSKVRNDEGEILVSWPALDSIYVYDAQFNFLKRVPSKSRFKSDLTLENTALTNQDVSRIVLTNTHYPLFIFDPYRELYYRFANIGGDFDPDNLVSSNSVLANEFSVLVYDHNLEFLGEQKFPAKTYNQYMAFVGEKGLYLPRTNFYSSEINEDQVVFDVFLYEN
ncbi:DUF4221 family protein [uncultured Algoriphagus sp.]|uniref:DUF4221 family protein n=1 Tax=uncultured Algoriphagus sp. TaxID=417365 RepID=UPI002584377A|nr:DUF4221 family protein [uncultured Algoriphagus sp.]